MRATRAVSATPLWAAPLWAALALAAPASPLAAEPYHGLWSGSPALCRSDRDGVERLEVNPTGFYWYESRCRGPVARSGPNAWTARLTCEGEGERWTRVTRIALAGPDRLVLENAPVGPTRRQAYARCPTPETPAGHRERH